MNKRRLSSCLLGFCALMLSLTSLSAKESEREHTVVGNRAESIETRLSQLETRDALASTTEKQEISARKNSISKKALFLAPNAAKSLYHYAYHPATYQSIASISYFGGAVELSDGSVWTVSTFDAPKASYWYPTDVVVITPNRAWLSTYAFRLTNQNTGESVAVDLNLGPIAPSFGSYYTHWITAVDYYHNIVYLEDGSVWKMSSFDSNTVYQWVVGDVVIVGVNDGWFSSSNPNILINVAMLNFASGAASF